MKKITVNFKGVYKEIILGPLFKLFEAVLELFVPLVMAGIIDVGVLGNNRSYVLKGGALLVLLAVLCVVAAMICQYYAAVAAGQFGKKLRAQVYGHVMSLSADEVTKYGPGGLITRMTNDVNQMQNGVNMTIRLATRAPFLAVGSIVMAMVVNLKIGLLFLAVTPVMALVLVFIMKNTLPSYGKIQQGQEGLSRLSGENLEGARVIRAFSRQKSEQNEYEQQADEVAQLMMRVGKVSSALSPLTGLIVNLAIIGIVWLGSGLVFRGEMLPGQIIALVSYMSQTLLAMIVAANLIVLFTRAVASTKRVAEILEIQPGIVDGPGAEPVIGAPVAEFASVNFSYHGGADLAIEDVSFVVEQGRTVGVIGGTGSGKSTLINLLLRYYDAGSGVVKMDGVDVRRYTLGQLRSKIGIVPQGAELFSGTVRRNIQIAKKEATDDEIWRALTLAQAADFVANMPEGLDTKIEEGGKNLSGGQRQRLTIARALVRQPELLVLDDSSSALDYATDAALQAALRQEAQQRRLSVVMVSQRVATLQNADMILVMDDGKLAGVGTHDQLLRKNNVYREICASQEISLPEEVE